MYKNLRRTSASVILTLSILAGYQCQSNDRLVTGKEIYKVYCVNCHGADGKLAFNKALDLSVSRLPLEGRKEIIRNGRMTMSGYSGVLSEAQIDSVAQYTIQLQE